MLLRLDIRELGDPRVLAERGKAPRHFDRDPASVDRVVLHQWGTSVSISRRARARIARGESTVEEEHARRGLEAPYHFDAGVAVVNGERRAFAAHVWDTSVKTWASNGQNAASVGVGVFGKFPRFERKWSRLRRHSPPCPDLAEAARAAVEMAAAECSSAAGLPPLLLTHSQLTDHRRADPGEYLIRTTVAPLVAAGVVRVLPDYSEGGGDPWPVEWRRHVLGAA